MDKSNRATVLAGNWKMNKTASEASELIKELIPAIEGANCDVVICVPYTSLDVAARLCKGTNISVGAQNCHYEESGAFTGEVSVTMLIESGVTHVIVGHSERRQYFGETDITVNLRARKAVSKGLIAIICVGELLEEREAGITEDVLSRQVKAALSDMTQEDMEHVIIAYEPVWAIGTGKTATSQQAGEACRFIRGIVEELFNADVAKSLTIQYGGSMNPSNAEELLAQEHVDGGLIGGASLKASDFKSLVDAASK
ncbi:MAG: triose-phosphate isomerase [Oscillospiraceae bacterium]|nr:triose-phosphate isomerase [Oscillospiraceae bacterium]